MIVKCENCQKYYDDVYRLTYCPHDTFLANDGINNFSKNENSYLSDNQPKVTDITRYRVEK